MPLLKNSFDYIKDISDNIIVLDLKHPLKKSFKNVYYLPSTKIRYENSRIFNNNGQYKNPYFHNNISSLGRPLSIIAFITNAEGARYVPYFRYMKAKIFTFDYQETRSFVLLPPGTSYYPKLYKFEEMYIPNMTAMLTSVITKKKLMYSNAIKENKRQTPVINNIYNNMVVELYRLMEGEDNRQSSVIVSNAYILTSFIRKISRFIDDKDISKSVGLLQSFIESYRNCKEMPTDSFPYSSFENSVVKLLKDFSQILDNDLFILTIYMFILLIL